MHRSPVSTTPNGGATPRRVVRKIDGVGVKVDACTSRRGNAVPSSPTYIVHKTAWVRSFSRRTTQAGTEGAATPREESRRIFAHQPTLRFAHSSPCRGDEFAVTKWTVQATPGDYVRHEPHGDYVPTTPTGLIARKDGYTTSAAPRIMTS
jgi:hypothetical protein